jgi:hypothetical protein
LSIGLLFALFRLGGSSIGALATVMAKIGMPVQGQRSTAFCPACDTFYFLRLSSFAATTDLGVRMFDDRFGPKAEFQGDGFVGSKRTFD